ncbi:hypothetical protein [Burkholderia plantarii]|uniref:hypothetical protein n=1 Tax=Burkholderia plantarii TaxID=41899 RepID=UPI000F4D9A69|nr:hypothetical protein [Burkholderia plantarii]
MKTWRPAGRSAIDSVVTVSGGRGGRWAVCNLDQQRLRDARQVMPLSGYQRDGPGGVRRKPSRAATGSARTRLHGKSIKSLINRENCNTVFNPIRYFHPKHRETSSNPGVFSN